MRRFKHFVHLGQLRFSLVHLTCFCAPCVAVCVGVGCGCGCAHYWKRGWAEGFCCRQSCFLFCLAGQSNGEGGWWESSAWVCQGRWCTSEDDLGGPEMKAEWNFKRTWKGRKQNLSIMSLCWQVVWVMQAYIDVGIRCNTQFCVELKTLHCFFKWNLNNILHIRICYNRNYSYYHSWTRGEKR